VVSAFFQVWAGWCIEAMRCLQTFCLGVSVPPAVATLLFIGPLLLICYIVLPEQDAVLVITAETGNMQGEFNLVWQYLSENKWTLADVKKEFRAQIEMGLKKLPHVSHVSAHLSTRLSDEMLALK